MPNELDNDLNNNPNLAIFRQTDNGVLVRMALFALVLDVVDTVDKYSHDIRWFNARAHKAILLIINNGASIRLPFNESQKN